jgi:hypothetical protein
VGAEKACKLRVGGKISRGTALLETDYVLFRGDVRLQIPFSEVRGVEAKDGVLRLSLTTGDVAFELGSVAARWAEKITRPKGIVEKLGVVGGAKVGLVGAFDAAFVRDLEATGARVTPGAKGKGYDHVLLAAEATADLAKVEPTAARLTPAGGLWIVYPKGRKDIREADVLGAGRAAGLKDVKVARFSETHTALRFVVPVAKRGA